MVNLSNRRLHFESVTEIVLQGPLTEAPANRLAMLTGSVNPEERSIACPNQDVADGIGALAQDVSPVIIRFPDFGDRFRNDQIVEVAK